MLAFYPEIKWVHVAAVACSGSLFLLRGLLVQAGHGALARRAPLRWLSYGIDCVLLTAALMLFTLLPGALFANGWLLAKLGLLVAYIVLGVMALRASLPAARRRASFVAALLVFATMVSIARAHHPLGWLQGWLA
jgi:uncharacterized membrane protein SirB2